MAAGDTTAADGDGGKVGLKAFFEREALIMLGLGYAAGMPNQLAGVALAAWLRDAGTSLTLLAFIGLATLTYSLKFLWAPVVDRVPIPVLDRLLGRRRSWMLVTQLTVMAGVISLAQFDPAESLVPIAILATLIGFAGATQDVAIDAWRIEVVKDENRLGILTATYQWGYRIAITISGFLPLLIAEAINGTDYAFAGWSTAYVVMGLLMLIAVLATLGAPRERAAPAPRWTAPAHIKVDPPLEALEWVARLGLMALGACFLATGLSGKHEPLAWLIGGLYGGGEAMDTALGEAPWGVVQQVLFALTGLAIVAAACVAIPGRETRPGAYFQSALGEPLMDFLRRYQGVAVTILLFICCYRIADFILNLATALYQDAGFLLSEIGLAQKIYGAIVSVIGAGLAGWAILRLGLFRCLIIGGFLQPLSNLAFILIALVGTSMPDVAIPLPNIIKPFEFLAGPQDWIYVLNIDTGLMIAIGIDNLSAMFAGTCLIVYMSRLTKEGFTATQYALFSSLYALPGKLIGAMSGRVVEGSAQAVQNGGLSFMNGWFGALPANAFAEPAAELGVAAHHLAAGYVVFFAYTALMGVAAVILAIMVSLGKPRAVLERNEARERGEAAPAPA